MRIGRIYRAVCISALIHGALLGAALYIAYLGSTGVPGSGDTGETIAVSMISEDGGIGSSGESLEIKRRKPVQASQRKLSSPMLAPSTSAGATADSADRRSGTPAGRGDPRLLRMWKKINRSKYYPLNARRNSWKGNPRVTFKTGKEGQVEYVRLAKSCGIAQLDNAAIETVRRAVPLPYYPKPITLTIRYSLKE